MKQQKKKLFRDSVHNYIAIDADICDKYIDTYLFQRLRAIEQTSMRVLYPSARHDRFIHSLGVYSLACRFFERIKPQISSVLRNRTFDIEKTFKLAALLHDCAHSPFSHTGEVFSKRYCKKINEHNLKKLLSSSFSDDYDYLKLKSGKEPAVHEIASAYVACKYYSKKFKMDNINQEQFARMITGITNVHPKDKETKCCNVFIKLLNGFIIDVDRLDYLLRDTWASGVNNATVDLERLISGVSVTKECDDLIIKGSAASSLINAIKARDFIYRWILPHHKVVYASQVLTDAMEELIDSLSRQFNKNKKVVASTLFGYKSLLEKVQLGDEYIYMPTDGDIIYLLKKYCHNKKKAKEVLTREYSYEPIWKSVTDFINLFPYPSTCHPDAKNEFYDLFLGKVKKYCRKKRGVLLTSEKEVIKITENDLAKVKVTSTSIPSLKRNLKLTTTSNISLDQTIYFYVYRRKGSHFSKETICREIKTLYDNCIQEKKKDFLKAIPRH